MNLKKISLFFVILCVDILSFAQVNKSDIADCRDRYLKTHMLNAIYAVYSGNEPLIQGAAGFYSKKIQEDPNSVDKLLGFEQKMPIASGTKQMSAAAILRLRDQKKLDVTDVLSKHLPKDSQYWGGNMPEWANKITIHNLLTHSSGLPEYIFDLKLDLTKSHKEINGEIVQFTAKSSLLFESGQKFQYCNSGYVLLGLIIESVSGKELREFFYDEFFAPLGMKDTHLSDLTEALNYQTGKLSDLYPNRYLIVPGSAPSFVPAPSDIKLPPFADGGVVSTARDMNKWMMALHNGEVISQDSLKLMTTPYIKSEDKMRYNAYYGYGIYIINENGKTIYTHGGNAIAVRGEYSYIKDMNIAVIVLSNSMVHIPESMKGKVDMSQDCNQIDIMFFNKSLISLICAN